MKCLVVTLGALVLPLAVFAVGVQPQEDDLVFEDAGTPVPDDVFQEPKEKKKPLYDSTPINITVVTGHLFYQHIGDDTVRYKVNFFFSNQPFLFSCFFLFFSICLKMFFFIWLKKFLSNLLFNNLIITNNWKLSFFNQFRFPQIENYKYWFPPFFYQPLIKNWTDSNKK